MMTVDTCAMVGAGPGAAVTLLPGQWHAGGQAASVRTLLGSCVAVALWHPRKRVGAMCHYVLPRRRRSAHERLDGRYADEALELIVQALRGQGVLPQECLAHLCGGADTLPDAGGYKFNIGQGNIEAGLEFMDRHGLQLQGVDVGDRVPRTITLQVASGQVTMVRGATLPA